MDVDPSPDERVRLAMRPKPPSADGIPIDEMGMDCYSLDDVEVQDQREKHWLRNSNVLVMFPAFTSHVVA
jgi:hypothetical protein